MSEPNPITFRAITRDNLDEILDLDVFPNQQRHVATNARSLAQASFYSEIAWCRAIYNGDVPVGFLMTSERVGAQPYLWRFMIDYRYQGRGFGQQALSILVDRLTKSGATALLSSCVAGKDGPLAFYQRFGFALTGEKDEDGEVIISLSLASPSGKSPRGRPPD
ncbi:MAG: GNAT family N-acetyltransferase, partial [Sphingomonas sp.]|nr:GNAT family N-acetyltransferase [Sphingomonas sp.]